jgi:branched-subunit amino acid ABC-type transport system permease component
MPQSKSKRSRYTPPTPTKAAPSPLWVPVVMATTLACGVIVIVANYLELLPGAPYPIYRLAIIAVGLTVALGLYVLIARTRVGMLIRAGAANRVMLGALGINVTLLYTLVFALGAALAALAPSCGRKDSIPSCSSIPPPMPT